MVLFKVGVTPPIRASVASFFLEVFFLQSTCGEHRTLSHVPTGDVSPCPPTHIVPHGTVLEPKPRGTGRLSAPNSRRRRDLPSGLGCRRLTPLVHGMRGNDIPSMRKQEEKFKHRPGIEPEQNPAHYQCTKAVIGK